MKRVLIILGILIIILGFSVNSNAYSTFFDFEDGISNSGPLPSSLNDYLDRTFKMNVEIVPISSTSTPSVHWFGEQTLFKSDMLFSLAAGGTLDFDPGETPSALKITQISFTWGIFDNTGRIDFGLNVFDDNLINSRTGMLGAWRNNVFAINNPETWIGDSGLMIFDPDWKITKFRFHNHDAHDVGIDNLTIVDNRDLVTIRGISTTVPEPSIMLLLGFGLVGFWGYKRGVGR